MSNNNLYNFTTVIELLNTCNFNCEHCFIDNPKPQQLSLKDIKHIILTNDNLLQKGKSLYQLTGGEISLYPYLKETIQLLAKYNKGIVLYTNASFAETNNITNKQTLLPNKEFTEILKSKGEFIYESKFVESKEETTSLELFIDETFKYLNKKQITNQHIQYYFNEALTAITFYNWADDMQAIRNDGENAIKQICIGYDSYHLQEREKRGMSSGIIYTKNHEIKKDLEEKLGIQIHTTQGEFPAYVGKSRKKTGFHKKNPIEKINRKKLLNKLYKENFKTIFDNTIEKDKLKEIFDVISTCGCLHTQDVSFLSDNSVNFCPRNIVPSFSSNIYKKNTNKHNKKEIRIRNAFFDNGGPLGVARSQNMDEVVIYKTLMEKGPCGLCDRAINHK